MTAASSRTWPVAFALWVCFLALLVAASLLLLRACELALFGTVWNFCPAGPASLAPEADRGGDLRRTVARLEADLAKKQLACAALPKPAPPPLDLPREAGEPAVQQSAEVKPPPAPPPPVAKPAPPPQPKVDLPADRWNKGDVSILEGCWRLGRETQTTRSGLFGRSEVCQVMTGTICFGAGGSGQRETSVICPQGGRITCRAGVSASFGGGNMHTAQPTVDCGRGNRWNGPPNGLSCQRVSDTLAMCRDGLGFSYEFRR